MKPPRFREAPALRPFEPTFVPAVASLASEVPAPSFHVCVAPGCTVLVRDPAWRLCAPHASKAYFGYRRKRTAAEQAEIRAIVEAVAEAKGQA